MRATKKQYGKKRGKNIAFAIAKKHRRRIH